MAGKNPAAVALGKRSAELRTPEQRAAITAQLMAHRQAMTREELRAIAKRAARTRRLSPKWVTMSPSSPAVPAAAIVTPAPAPAEALQLAAAAVLADVDHLTTEELFAQVEALVARIPR